MTARALLDHLRAQGVRFATHRGRLRVVKGNAWTRAHKTTVRAALQSDPHAVIDLTADMTARELRALGLERLESFGWTSRFGDAHMEKLILGLEPSELDPMPRGYLKGATHV